MNRIFFLAPLLCAWIEGPVEATPLCQEFTDTVKELDLIYLDRADPLLERVTQSLEADLLRAQVDGSTPAPLQKIYCRIGMFELRVRFVQPAEDDAVKAIVTEATYGWDAEQDPAGWVLSQLRRQAACTRGDATFADICP